MAVVKIDLGGLLFKASARNVKLELESEHHHEKTYCLHIDFTGCSVRC